MRIVGVLGRKVKNLELACSIHIGKSTSSCMVWPHEIFLSGHPNAGKSPRKSAIQRQEHSDKGYDASDI